MTLQGDFEGETEGDAILRTFLILRQWKPNLQIHEIRYDLVKLDQMIKWLIIATSPEKLTWISRIGPSFEAGDTFL